MLHICHYIDKLTSNTFIDFLLGTVEYSTLEK